MDWNAESDLLAITLVGEGHNDLQYGKEQFYYRNNYHWYLKHEIHLKDGVKVSNVRFDGIKGYMYLVLYNIPLILLYKNWRDYRFTWDASATPQRGTAVVVDGNNLNLTTARILATKIVKWWLGTAAALSTIFPIFLQTV